MPPVDFAHPALIKVSVGAFFQSFFCDVCGKKPCFAAFVNIYAEEFRGIFQAVFQQKPDFTCLGSLPVPDDFIPLYGN